MKLHFSLCSLALTEVSDAYAEAVQVLVEWWLQRQRSGGVDSRHQSFLRAFPGHGDANGNGVA